MLALQNEIMEKTPFAIDPGFPVSTRESEICHQVASMLNDDQDDAVALDLNPGQVCFYQGHYPQGVAVLEKGKLVLLRSSLSGPVEKSVAIPGTVFGLFNLVAQLPFMASATAETETRLWFFPKAKVLRLIQTCAQKAGEDPQAVRRLS